jgi:hypothetical protein
MIEAETLGPTGRKLEDEVQFQEIALCGVWRQGLVDRSEEAEDVSTLHRSGP